MFYLLDFSIIRLIIMVTLIIKIFMQDVDQCPTSQAYPETSFSGEIKNCLHESCSYTHNCVYIPFKFVCCPRIYYQTYCFQMEISCPSNCPKSSKYCYLGAQKYIMTRCLRYPIVTQYSPSITTTPSVATTIAPITPSTIAPCVAPDNRSGLILANGVVEVNDPVIRGPDAQCICDVGILNFYIPANTINFASITADSEQATTVSCPNMCICRADGICCTPTDPAPDSVTFIAVVTDGQYAMYSFINGFDEMAGFMCTDGTTYDVQNQFEDPNDPLNANVKNFTPDAPYIQAVSVSCNGCDGLTEATCTGPTVDI